MIHLIITFSIIRLTFFIRSLKIRSLWPGTYLENKQKYGSFWGLFLVGLDIRYLKWTLLDIFLFLLLNITVSITSNMLYKYINETQLFLVYLLYNKICASMNRKISIYLDDLKKEERIIVTNKIFNYVNNMYINAPYRWQIKYPYTSQKDSLTDVFWIYINIIFQLESIVTNSIQTVYVFLFCIFYDFYLGMFIIISNICLSKYKKYINKQVELINKTAHEHMSVINTRTATLFTNRHLVKNNPIFVNIDSNPLIGLNDNERFWNNKNLLTRNTNASVSILQNIIIFCMCWYLSDNKDLLLFVLINQTNMFGLISIINDFKQIEENNISRLTATFKMLDDLNDTHTYRSTKESILTKIQITSFKYNVTNNITLSFDGVVDINLLEKGIILFDGPKGCGKSVLMDIFAGHYDGSLSNDVFKKIADNRLFMWQKIAATYIHNRKQTLSVTLGELFGGDYDKIKDTCSHFGLCNKLPKDLNTPISDNERGVSPGEIQSFLLASIMFRALELDVKLLLLDEPEQNIDHKTVLEIFRWFFSVYKYTVVLITHSEDLKKELCSMIKQRLVFQEPMNNQLNFRN